MNTMSKEVEEYIQDFIDGVDDDFLEVFVNMDLDDAIKVETEVLEDLDLGMPTAFIVYCMRKRAREVLKENNQEN